MKHIIRILMFCLLVQQVTAPDLQAASFTPCAAEVGQYCKKVKPGGGRISGCLLEHEQELSTACREHLAVLQRKARKMDPVCRDDVEQFCMDTFANERFQMIRCLRQHKADLSAECSEKLGDGD